MATVTRAHAVPDDPILGVHGVGGHRWGIANQPLSTRGHGSRLLLPCVRGLSAASTACTLPRGSGTDLQPQVGGICAGVWHGCVTATRPCPFVKACCSAQATRKPTVIVGHDEEGIRCRAPGWLLQSGDCAEIVPWERAEGRGLLKVGSARYPDVALISIREARPTKHISAIPTGSWLSAPQSMVRLPRRGEGPRGRQQRGNRIWRIPTLLPS